MDNIGGAEMVSLYLADRLGADLYSTVADREKIKKMGFVNVYLYPGGLFEWLLLQDIYGDDEFSTTIKELNILKYKPDNIINNFLLLH